MSFLERLFGNAKKSEASNSNTTEQYIQDCGVINQPRLWRRWVMGQMFRMLRWGSSDEFSEQNYDLRLSFKQIMYARRLVTTEKKIQLRLMHDGDKQEYAERSRWFSPSVYDEVMHADWAVPQSFKDAFKGAGAYFTMKNMILFHSCTFVRAGVHMSKEESLKLLTEANENPMTSAHTMFELMMKLIADNNFVWHRKHRSRV